MKVIELIEKLQKLDKDLEVFVPGYEGGFDDISKLEPVRLCKGFYIDDESWYYGDHEEYDVVRKGPADPNAYEIVKGIVISKC